MSKPAAAVHTRSDRRLTIDEPAFSRDFDRAPFTIAHQLTTHPLFALPRLVELARTLPAASVEYNGGNLPISADPGLTPRTGLSPEESIHRIEEFNSWMALLNVEQVPEYRRLLDECLAEIRRLSDRTHPGMVGAEAFVFVSSAGAVTPYRMDPEHNFLLQIRGTKTVTIFDGRDRSVLGESDLEYFYAGAKHRNMKFRDEWESKGRAFDLAPGLGVHVPVTYPHYVRVGGEYSVSFSVTFRTPDLARRSLVHRLNRQLRRRGWTPAPRGVSPWRDALKYAAARAIQRVTRRRR